jgi:hypothetical protein
MSRHHVLTIFALSATFSLAAQVKSSDILATAFNDQRVNQAAALVQATSDLRFHIPILKTVQARIGIAGSALGDTIYGTLRNEDAYGLIIGANSLRQIKHQKAFKQVKMNLYQAQGQVSFEQAVYDRYRAIASVYFAQKELEQLLVLDQLLNKKREILRISAEKGLEFKTKDLIETEKDYLKNAQEIREKQESANEANLDLAQFTAQTTSMVFDTSNFISLRQISDQLTLQATNIYPQPEARQRADQTKLAEWKRAYIQTENRQIFNDIRIGYDYPRFLIRPNKFNPTNNLSLRVGLNVPLPGNNRFKASEAKLSVIESKMAEERYALQNNQARFLLIDKLKMQLALHKQQMAIKENTLFTRINQNPKLLNALTPFDLVELQIAEQILTVALMRTAQQAVLTYLDYLRAHGLLVAQPYINYLTESRETWSNH